jgi:hypothetical protein
MASWALLDALHHGDTNGNALIELSELVAHVPSEKPTEHMARRDWFMSSCFWL